LNAARLELESTLKAGERVPRSGAANGRENAPAAAEFVAAELPDKPVLTIESGRRWAGLDLRDLWAHRDLFYFLVWRDVKVRYKQTALGVAWAVLQPVLTMVVFSAIFGRLAGVPSDGEPYPIFVYAGLLPWNFFNQAVTSSSNSLVGNSTLITKVYFPRLVIPGAAVGAGLVDFAIAAVILFVMAFYYGVAFGAGLLMLVPLAMLTTLFAAAVGMWMSALNVKYRDVRYALPFVLQIWMYVTPIIYPVTFIPAHWRWVIALNPLSGMIQGFRSAIFGRPFDWSAIALSAAVTLTVLIYAAYAFRRMEKEFADII
jgi:lipopolysaccharide transport system permease protein